MTAATAATRVPPLDSSRRSKRGIFPGWRWAAVGFAFPVAGLIGWTIGGRADAVEAALVGGGLTGAGLGAVQWWAAEGALGRAAAWLACFTLARAPAT